MDTFLNGGVNSLYQGNLYISDYSGNRQWEKSQVEDTQVLPSDQLFITFLFIFRKETHL